MAENNGIRIYLRINGKIQQMYDGPDQEDSNDLDGMTVYVEAVTDERFEVIIALQNGCQFLNADGYLVTLIFDGGKRWQKYYNKSLSSRWMYWKFQPIYDRESGKWGEGAFYFGTLKGLESSHTLEEASEIFKDLGKIRVEVRRAKARKRWEPEGYVSDDYIVNDSFVAQVPTNFLRLNAIENVIRVVPVQYISRPIETHEYKPLPGPDGRVFAFNVLYRSKETLQNLGRISRSPSPVHSLRPEEELNALQARLAVLQRRLNNKPEPWAPVLKTAIGVRVPSRSKRERDDSRETSHRKRLVLGAKITDLMDD